MSVRAPVLQIFLRGVVPQFFQYVAPSYSFLVKNGEEMILNMKT